MTKKIIGTLLLLVMYLVILRFGEQIIFPVMSMDMGVEQLEDSNAVFQELQALEWSKSVFGACAAAATVLAMMLIWLKPMKRILKGRKK